MTAGWERGWDQKLHLTTNNHWIHTVVPWKSRHNPGTYLLRKHFICWQGPAVAEVWYNIRLTLCTSLQAYRKQADSKAQGHTSLGHHREIVLLVSLCPIFSSHYFIFYYTFFFTLYLSLAVSLSLFLPSGCSSWGQYPPLCSSMRTQESHE